MATETNIGENVKKYRNKQGLSQEDFAKKSGVHRVKHAHFIGICGVGMSAVAKLLLDAGWSVSGSDDGFYPPISTYLKSIGVKCMTPHKASNIPQNTDIIIIGKHKKLVPKTNAEVKKALDGNIPVKSYPEILNKLTKNKENIIVAGSFGKSTTTTLLSWVLSNSGISPSYFIGALPKNNIQPAKLDNGKIFVLEGDEYPTSNWDNSSKFLHYNPSHVILISCKHDHLDVFHTHKEYLSRFKKLVKKLPTNGILLYCVDDEFTQDVANGTSAITISYSTHNNKANWYAENLNFEEEISFDLTNKGRKVCTIKSNLFGLHNAQNIIAVCAMAIELKLITITQLQKNIKQFEGTHNRIENISKNTSKPIYKDIASSSYKVKASLSAIRAHHPDKHITLIFEPYSLSFRHKNSLTLNWYQNLFDDVDKVLFMTPRKIGKRSSENVVVKNISKNIKNDTDIVYIDNKEDIKKYFDKHKAMTEVIVVMSSGNAESIVNVLNLLK